MALGRKNSLFAGSDEAAQNWAVLATLVQCCKLRNVDPQAYFDDVLSRLVNGHPQARIAELIPWRWTPVQG
jgi:transposase